MKFKARIDTWPWRTGMLRLSPGVLLAMMALAGGACSTTTPSTKDVPCEGPACHDIRISYDGCYHVANRGEEQVVIVMSPWTRVVAPGEQMTLMSDVADAPCPKAYYGSAKAKY